MANNTNNAQLGSATSLVGQIQQEEARIVSGAMMMDEDDRDEVEILYVRTPQYVHELEAPSACRHTPTGLDALYQQALQKTQDLRAQMQAEEAKLHSLRNIRDYRVLDLCYCPFDGTSTRFLDRVREYLGLNIFYHEGDTWSELEEDSTTEQKLLHERKRHEELEYLLDWMHDTQDIVRHTDSLELILEFYEQYHDSPRFANVLDMVRHHLGIHTPEVSASESSDSGYSEYES